MKHLQQTYHTRILHFGTKHVQKKKVKITFQINTEGTGLFLSYTCEGIIICVTGVLTFSYLYRG